MNSNNQSPPSGQWNTPPQSYYQSPNWASSPSQMERQSLKRTIRRILPAIPILFLVENLAGYGISWIINLLLSSRIQLAVSGMLQFPPDTYYGMGQGMYDLLTSYLPVVIGEIAAVLYLRPISGISFKRLFSRPQIPTAENMRFTERKTPAWVWILFAAVAGIGFSMIGQLLAMIELNFLYTIGFPYYSPDFSTAGYTLIDTVLCNLYVCLLGPIMEEIIFRGFLLKTCQRHGVSFAAVFTAILFTMYHMNLVQLCVPLLMVLFFAELAIRTDSLIPSLVCHIFNNTLATLLDYITPSSDIWSWVFLIVECAVFIGVLAVFWIYYGKELSGVLKWRHPVLKLSSQIGAAYATWPMIIFTVLYIGMIAMSSLATLFS